jgi:mono/diheme cytochrome c family protein
MTVSKVPKALILFVVLALAGAVVVAGCGGGSSTTEATVEEEAAPPAEEEKAEEEPAEEAEEEEPAEEKEEEAGGEGGGGEAALVAEGKTVFTSNCGSCHTLKAAGTSGNVGPNLDELAPDDATVEHQVINGGGGMPAFGKEGTLSPEEIKAVSAYVSTEAGK